jgi:hypothetical protein
MSSLTGSRNHVAGWWVRTTPCVTVYFVCGMECEPRRSDPFEASPLRSNARQAGDRHWRHPPTRRIGVFGALVMAVKVRKHQTTRRARFLSGFEAMPSWCVVLAPTDGPVCLRSLDGLPSIPRDDFGSVDPLSLVQLGTVGARGRYIQGRPSKHSGRSKGHRLHYSLRSLHHPY